MRRAFPFSRQPEGAPYFPPPVASPGRRVGRVVARLLPCECRRQVIEVCDAREETLGPCLDMLLDAAPVADGRYVVVENAIGGQAARPYEEALHKGWRRYNAHVCKEESYR